LGLGTAEEIGSLLQSAARGDGGTVAWPVVTTGGGQGNPEHSVGFQRGGEILREVRGRRLWWAGLALATGLGWLGLWQVQLRPEAGAQERSPARDQPVRVTPTGTLAPKTGGIEQAAPFAPLREETLEPRLAGAGLKLGSPLPKLPLFDQAGQAWDWTTNQKQHQVYIGGCITCQVFLDRVDGLERVAREFADRGVALHYVQPRITHAEIRRLTEAYTLRERLWLGERMARELGGPIPWLVSGPGSDAAKNWRVHQPNFELVVAPTGELLRAREWSDPAELRDYLHHLLPAPPGTHEDRPAAPAEPVDEDSAVSDRDTDTPPRARRLADIKASRGFDPKPLDKPLYMPPFRVVPDVPDPAGNYPLKLRVEGQRSLLKGGAGQWFLRFNVDPLYEWTWPTAVQARRVVIRVQSVEESPRELARYELASPPGPQPGAPPGWRAHPLEHLTEAPKSRSVVRLQLTTTLIDSHGQPVPVAQSWLVRFEELPE